ncbi:glycoside hydrolase superfamily [Kockovaella imperatae]|uniref:Glycoside hydrolase superfamily n=1 Tax=Kockovaella imperatae TaxID=4999 RepID=A0A1Y1UBI0_9TREE|nr:glycoside hydrolase superfamily [Kockovaella imperatae]ORX34846.1 glycoside hydrolase superfamily [Kockovaella imperatae]
MLLALLILAPLLSTSYEVKTPPLDTPWTYTAGTDPWPEYPRPQQVRDRWQSLNGIWSWRNGAADELNGPVPTGNLGTDVLVPSCLESGLSGVMANNTGNGTILHSWYQTTFNVTEDWQGENILINFGAVDYQATVFVNGQQVVQHTGGYLRFWADITSAVKVGQSNELVVFVFDPTDSEPYVVPIGKQTLNPSHIFYTPCTGIWQQVFIEPVPADHIEWIDLDGDMNGQVNITVHSANNSSSSVTVKVWADDGQVAATGTGSSDSPIVFEVANPKLWSPESPTLYNITVTLGNDTVATYTGFRTVGKGMVNGMMRPLLNGEFLFTFGPLDQGFWPDGIYTPPNYEAMVFDLKTLKSLGMNMIRKHIKVEMDLFYHACDTMGFWVIQDQPALNIQNGAEPNSTQQDVFNSQLFELVEKHRSFPSICTWVIYNEGWGQVGAPELYLAPMVRSLDPTRLIDATTGWNWHGAGDYVDNHHYSEPQCGTPFYSIASSPYDPNYIGFQGEFGGIGNNVSIDHLWNVQQAINGINQTYELDATVEIWNYRAHLILDELRQQTEMFACSGAVWTQTTDVEGEVNGFLTYDRRILRPNITQWQSDIYALYQAAADRGGRIIISTCL